MHQFRYDPAYYPSSLCLVLPYLLNRPHEINDTTLLFARLFGVIVVAALSPGLFAGARNTRNAIKSPSVVYIILSRVRLFLILMLVMDALKGRSDAVLGYKKQSWGQSVSQSRYRGGHLSCLADLTFLGDI